MHIQYQSAELIIFESALFRTTSTLIIQPDYLLLVDPNWLPREISFIQQTIQPLLKTRKGYLLFTHSDYDHIIGYEAFPFFETIASANFVANSDKQAILKQINDFDDQYYIQRSYSISYPTIQHVVAGEEEAITLNGHHTALQCWQAPGHNADGLLSFHKATGTLIVGDYLSNVEFPYVYHSFAAYEATLNKVEQIIRTQEVHILISGHGDYCVEKAGMHTRIKESRQYLQAVYQHTRGDKVFPIESLWNRYNFPGIMTTFHNANLTLAKQERTA